MLIPLKRPTADELCNIFSGFLSDFYNESTEFGMQCKEVKEFNESITSKSNDVVSSSSYITHPQAIYTSRLLDYKNLPEPQNSKEINIQFYTGISFPKLILFCLFILY